MRGIVLKGFSGTAFVAAILWSCAAAAQQATIGVLEYGTRATRVIE